MVVLLLVIALSVVGALLVYRLTLGQMAEAPAAPQVEQALELSILRPLPNVAPLASPPSVPMTGAAVPPSAIPSVAAPLASPTFAPTIPPTQPAYLPANQRHLPEKEYMLGLINAERSKAGVPPVALGTNDAAQLHAELSLANCVTSHWGSGGLKPYMRYSLAGGYQANGENVSGSDYCITESDRYNEIDRLAVEIEGAMGGWMTSQGHRRTILTPPYKKVNIGIAFDRYNVVMVQHFEGDYVEYDQVPTIAEGVLTLSGKTMNGVRFNDADDLGVQVYYDQPPYSLTAGQLSRTYCYDGGTALASLRKPLPDGRFWTSGQSTQPTSGCPDPYEVSADAPAARSHDEAHRLWEQAYNASKSGLLEETVTVDWITADEWTALGDAFAVKANLKELLDKHGPGVYSIVVWGQSQHGEDMVISEYSVFHGVTPPDTYGPTHR